MCRHISRYLVDGASVKEGGTSLLVSAFNSVIHSYICFPIVVSQIYPVLSFVIGLRRRYLKVWEPEAVSELVVEVEMWFGRRGTGDRRALEWNPKDEGKGHLYSELLVWFSSHKEQNYGTEKEYGKWGGSEKRNGFPTSTTHRAEDSYFSLSIKRWCEQGPLGLRYRGRLYNKSPVLRLFPLANLSSLDLCWGYRRS